MKRLIFLSAFLLLFHFGFAQQVVKMVHSVKQPIVRAKLNGKTAYFLIDTGADITCLNQDDSRRYKFIYRRVPARGMLSGFDSRTSKHLVASRVEMKLGDISMKARYKVLDLSNVVESIFWDSGIRIAGIIGSDMMKKYHFVIDYKSEQISFLDKNL